jgi:hypothetical protein
MTSESKLSTDFRTSRLRDKAPHIAEPLKHEPVPALDEASENSKPLDDYAPVPALPGAPSQPRPPPLIPDRGRQKLPSRLVCRRYGISDRTLARWERDPVLNFPAPTLINLRKYYDLAELDEWDRSNTSKTAAQGSSK